MPSNLLLLPLLGGFWFIHVFYYTRFRSQRLDGNRLLLSSALAGVVCAFAGRVLATALRSVPVLHQGWRAIAAPDIPYLGTALVSLLIGGVSAYLLNFVLSVTGWVTEKDAQRKAIQRHGNHLLRLLHRAANEERTVSVTLDNRKVYIGLLAAAPNLESHETFFSLTPFLSGYRDKDTLELVFTTDYLHVYEKGSLDVDDCNVALPIASVRSASLFDHTVYDDFRIESLPEEAAETP